METLSKQGTLGTSSAIPAQFCGQIQLILGPMFSGKSTELLRRIRRYVVCNLSCLVIKYKKDNRYSEKNMSTHDLQMYEAEAAESLIPLIPKASKFQVIAVDEGQFFPDITVFCEEMANEGKIVIIAALDGDFERKRFGDILSLIPKSEHVVKLHAVCKGCKKDAAFSHRLTSEKQQQVIGSVNYVALCRQCYNEQNAVEEELELAQL